MNFNQSFINNLILDNQVENYCLIDTSIGYNTREILFCDTQKHEYFEFVENNEVSGVRKLLESEIEILFSNVIYATNH